MTPTIAIIGAGAMGSAVGQRLVNHGCKVITWIEGRSAATVQRARMAGMVAVPLEQLGEAEMVLSIVPPGVARAIPEQLLPVLAAAARKPVYVDCNAVSPQTVEEIAKVVARSSCGFVDAGIIGPPPSVDPHTPSTQTVFYASGSSADRFAELTRYGMNIRVIEGGIGRASAVKMSFAGVTKGVTAIGTAMLLAAARAGVTDELFRELAASRPDLLDWFELQIPKMFPKAYRWVAEMEEISRFAEWDEATRQLYFAIARLYERVAHDVAESNIESGALLAALKSSRLQQ
jgi:L-threonate 2-dehydrogenase